MEEFTRILQPPMRPPIWRWSALDAHLRGVLLMLAAAFLFALMFALPKLAGGGLNGIQATFVRYVAGLLTIVPIALLAARRGVPLTTPAWPMIGLRALSAVASVSCVIHATTHMAYADAMAISFADGVFVLMLAGLVLKEPVSRGRWAAAAVCLSGAVIVAQPSPDLLGRVLMEPAAGVAFLGAFLMAVEVIVIKHLTHRVAGTIVLLYTNLFAVALAAAPALYFGGWPSFDVLAVYALMGPVAIAGQYVFLHSLRQADVSALVPYKYATLIFAGLLGIVLFGQWPDLTTAVGAALIIGAGVRLTRSEAKAP